MTLTKSTLSGNGQVRKTPNVSRGYISDYYLKKNMNINEVGNGNNQRSNEVYTLSRDKSKDAINSGAY